jgi:hypothetical protein
METHVTPLGALVALAPVATAVAAGLWGLYTYLDRQRENQLQVRCEADREIVARQIEATRPFLDQQTALYLETSKVSGQLVVLDPAAPEWAAAEKRFWQLYWSELSLVEVPEVAGAMVDQAQLLCAYVRDTGLRDAHPSCATIPSPPPTSPQEARANVQRGAVLLAHKLRDSIQASWRIGVAAPASCLGPTPPARPSAS